MTPPNSLQLAFVIPGYVLAAWQCYKDWRNLAHEAWTEVSADLIEDSPDDCEASKAHDDTRVGAPVEDSVRTLRPPSGRFFEWPFRQAPSKINNAELGYDDERPSIDLVCDTGAITHKKNKFS